MRSFRESRFVTLGRMFGLCFFAGVALVPAAAQEPQPSTNAQRFSIVLKGGTLIDGTGSEGRQTDVAIRNGTIAAIDPSIEGGDMVIDCRGLIVCPGFIDLHTHSDSAIVDPKTAGNVNYLLQGCTTVVTGNCGMGPVDVAGYLAKVDAQKAGTHVAHLLPHGSLRDQVVGKEDRKATPEELTKMRELAHKAMVDGAYGMSTGLIYVPGMFAPTEELVEIAKVIGEQHGIYVSHIRSEGTGLMDALSEALRIGKEGQLPIHVSHFKAAGKASWGSLHLGVQLLQSARDAGQAVTADQYPYNASSTSLEATLMPDWAREGGRSAIAKRLADPEQSARIREDVAKVLARSNTILLASFGPRRDWVGMSLEQIAKKESRELVDIVLEIERLGGASVVNFSMNEEDVFMAMKLPWVATASDGGAKIPTSDRPHPRSFGTFPRKIGRYAIQEKVLPLAQAIHSATGLPATIIGLQDRGTIAVGKAADVTIFDPQVFIDNATFEQPYRSPSGIKYVLVAGIPAVYDGQATGARNGVALRKNQNKPE